MPAIDYTEQLTCECKPCPDCAGEGQIYSYITVGYSVRGLARQVETSYACRECHGAGQLTDDCEIHSEARVDDPGGAFDPKYGITAEHLGLSDGSGSEENRPRTFLAPLIGRTAIATGCTGLANQVCPACDAGEHELPKLAPCSCPCHTDATPLRRAA